MKLLKRVIDVFFKKEFLCDLCRQFFRNVCHFYSVGLITNLLNVFWGEVVFLMNFLHNHYIIYKRFFQAKKSTPRLRSKCLRNYLV